MITVDQIIDDTIRKETEKFTETPGDRGGATKFGVTAVTLGEWRRLGRPATREEVQRLTLEEARQIYRRRYVQPFEAIPFEAIRAQLVDFGVTSGPVTAIKALQRALGVPDDGILGPRTRTALCAFPWALTHGAAIAQRVKFYSDLAEAAPNQRQFLRGWIARAVSFL